MSQTIVRRTLSALCVVALTMPSVSAMAAAPVITVRPGSAFQPAPVQTRPDLALQIAGPQTITQGMPLALEVTVSNHGTKRAPGTRVHFSMPAGGWKILSAPGCKKKAGILSCEIGAVKIVQPTTFTIVLSTPKVCVAGKTYVSGLVENDEKEPSMIDNVAIARFTLECPQEPSSSSASSVSSASSASSVSSTPSSVSSSSVSSVSSTSSNTPATLAIAVKTIGSTDIAVRNQKDVQLLRFAARALGTNQLFTRAVFSAQSGSLMNAEKYALWVDTTGDGVVETILQANVHAQNGRITFDNLANGGYVLPTDEDVDMEVHADMASSTINNDLQLQLATTDSDFVAAERLQDGSSLSGIAVNGQCSGTCEIVVTTVASKLYVIGAQGDLFVTLDSTPSRNRQLLAGTLGETILRVQFRAQNEDIDVTNLQITSRGSQSRSIDRLELYKDGATTPFAMATIAGCGSDDVLSEITLKTFCASMQNGELIVHDGTDLDVLVKPRLKSDTQGALSNEKIQLFITGQNVSDNATGSGAVRARGVASSSNLAANDQDGVSEGEVFIGTDSAGPNSDIVGNVNAVSLSKITSITNANPDANGTSVPTGVSPFAQMRFTAATNSNALNGLNKATISGIILNVNATNVALDAAGFRFYNKADSSMKAACHALNTDGTLIATAEVSGTFLVECRDLKTSGVDVQLESGESSTFVLDGNVTNPQVIAGASSNLQASFQDFTHLDETKTFGATASHIDWIDDDYGPASIATTTTRFRWIEYPDTVVRSTMYAN